MQFKLCFFFNFRVWEQQLKYYLVCFASVLDPTPAPTIDPRINMQPAFNPPAAVQSPLTPPLDPQAALLALLTQAAASSGNLSTSWVVQVLFFQLISWHFCYLKANDHKCGSITSVRRHPTCCVAAVSTYGCFCTVCLANLTPPRTCKCSKVSFIFWC